MEICRGKSSSSHVLLHLILLYLLIISHLTISPCEGDESAEDKEKRAPDATERGIGTIGVGRRWEDIRAWAKLTWMNIRPWDSRLGQKASGASEKLKDVSKKSFEASKETVEQTAAAAAKAADEALGKTKEKLKRSVSTSDGEPQDAEL